MPLLDGDLRGWLLQRAAIAEAVVDRIHAVRLPQGGAMPAIVLTLVSSVAVTSNDGYSNLRFRRLQVDIYGQDFDAIAALAEEVFAALVGFEGVMGSTQVRHVRLLSERDLDEEGLEINSPVFRRTQDYEIAEGAD